MPRVGGDKNKTHVPLELTEGIRGLGLRLGLLTGESRSAGSTGTDCFYSKEERPPNRNSHRSHRAARARGRSWKAFLFLLANLWNSASRWIYLSFSPLRFTIIKSEKAMAPHSSTLAWKIPWMEEPGGLQSMGSLGVGHD